jgi:hypothetical protein
MEEALMWPNESWRFSHKLPEEPNARKHKPGEAMEALLKKMCESMKWKKPDHALWQKTTTTAEETVEWERLCADLVNEQGPIARNLSTAQGNTTMLDSGSCFSKDSHFLRATSNQVMRDPILVDDWNVHRRDHIQYWFTISVRAASSSLLLANMVQLESAGHRR